MRSPRRSRGWGAALLGLLACSQGALLAQDGSNLSGRILESDGSPIEEVLVAVDGEARALTDVVAAPHQCGVIPATVTVRLQPVEE